MNENNSDVPGFQLRLAESADAAAITTVINAAFRQTEDSFVDRDRIDLEDVLMHLETGKFLVAEREGIVAGCVYVEPKSKSESEVANSQFPRAYLGLLAVDPAHQQSGLGSLLMKAAEDYCRGLGCRFMDISVVNLREDLPDYYHRRGYVQTGTAPFPAEIPTRLPCYFIKMSKPL
jgi:predicted N-acetyltransferase YhbS